MSTVIFGRSDDLIELGGDIEEEFSHYSDTKWAYLHFDEGTVVRAGHCLVDGKEWAIEVVKSGAATATFLEPEMDDGEHYTDRLVLDGVKSVELWRSQDGPTRDDLEKWFDDFAPYGCTAEQLLAAYRALKS